MTDSQHQQYSIIAESVTKTYREGLLRKKYTHALTGVSLKIRQGEIFGLLGPNGAGKTTLLSIFAHQLTPDSGEVTIFGKKLNGLGRRELAALKARINMCSGNPNFPWSLTVKELLNFYSMLHGMPKNKRGARIRECMHLVELDDFQDTRYDRLSTGTKQKLALAKSLLNEPELLLLDEPTVGLAPDTARKIRRLIFDIHSRTGNTVILTTHHMQEAEQLCDRVAFIMDGTIKASGSSDDLKSLTRSANLEEAFLELAH